MQLSSDNFCLPTESLNANMEKAENPDAVVATEPQGKYTFTVFSSFIYNITILKLIIRVGT